jgi:hypothetical protein
VSKPLEFSDSFAVKQVRKVVFDLRSLMSTFLGMQVMYEGGMKFPTRTSSELFAKLLAGQFPSNFSSITFLSVKLTARATFGSALENLSMSMEAMRSRGPAHLMATFSFAVQEIQTECLSGILPDRILSFHNEYCYRFSHVAVHGWRFCYLCNTVHERDTHPVEESERVSSHLFRLLDKPR